MSKRIDRPGIKLVGMPGPVVAHALQSPLTRRLVITDAGCYPNAVGHRTHRERGIPETIVVICTKGVGWLQMGKDKHRISTHEVFVVPAGVPHEYWADSDDPWTTWWVHITGTDVPELVEAIGATEVKPVVPIHSTERAIALLSEILTALETAPSPVRMLSTTGAAWKLLTQIAVDQALPKPGAPLQRAFTYLEDRLDTSIRVPELAAFVGLSPSHLTALFHKATGGGVLAHHTALRMARARQLLDLTDASIAEVAHEIGFDDPFYFSR